MGRSVQTTDAILREIACPSDLRKDFLWLGEKLLGWRYDDRLGLWWMGPIPAAESRALRFMRSFEGIDEVIRSMFSQGWSLSHLVYGTNFKLQGVPEMRHLVRFVKEARYDPTIQTVRGKRLAGVVRGYDGRDIILQAAIRALRSEEKAKTKPRRKSNV